MDNNHGQTGSGTQGDNTHDTGKDKGVSEPVDFEKMKLGIMREVGDMIRAIMIQGARGDGSDPGDGSGSGDGSGDGSGKKQAKIKSSQGDSEKNDAEYAKMVKLLSERNLQLLQREFFLTAKQQGVINPKTLLPFVDLNELDTEEKMVAAIEPLKQDDSTRHLFYTNESGTVTPNPHGIRGTKYRDKSPLEATSDVGALVNQAFGRARDGKKLESNGSHLGDLIAKRLRQKHKLA